MKKKYLFLSMSFLTTPILATYDLNDGSASSAINGISLVTFDDGEQGWEGPPRGTSGGTIIDPEGGNTGNNLHTVFFDFGITFKNNSNPDFVFDYSTQNAVTFSIDVKVDSIIFDGNEVFRPFVIEFRDYNEEPGGYPWVSVWHKIADISHDETGTWATFTVHIENTTAEELPEGWGGYGAEDADFNPILPRGRTFANVLSNVDEVAFTTYQPGMVFGFTTHDIRIDNVAIFKDRIFMDSFE